MKYSQMFGKTIKQIAQDEESINAQLLIKAGYVDKVMAGVYTFLPLGFRVLKKIEKIIRDEMVSLDGQEIFMPTLHPKVNWEKTERWNTYDSLFRFTSHYTKTDYALGPTHEEIVSPLAKSAIFSYKDLPLAVFQIQNKFRDEKRAKAGILRGREFLMKDLYSFHTDEKDLSEYYEKVKNGYINIYKKVGIGDVTYLTFASGGSFSQYSHEFQTITSAGEDTIYVCEKCKIAINKEIISEQDSCVQCGNKDLKEIKAIEVGNIFQLKTKFSEPFELRYKDSQGAEHDVIMGCYGIGLTRLMGTIVEVSHDEKGIVWPKNVSPFQAHLLVISNQSLEVSKKAEEVYEDLLKAGIEVLYDDREDVSPGVKFSDADLIGIPVRLVVSSKSGDKIEWKERSKKEIELLSFDEVLQKLS